tara:strand:+ start:274 stop:591 length:318 start_codon:yes stop_codon:yes gene_type:complete
MSEELESIDEFEISGGLAVLPNATAVLISGILSIITFVFFGLVGLILGIIVISMHSKDKALYQSNKGKYTRSFKNSRAGYVCGIIGLSLSLLLILIISRRIQIID